MVSCLDDAPFVEDDDHVGMLDRGKAVGNDERGPPFTRLGQSALYQGLRLGVDV